MGERRQRRITITVILCTLALVALMVAQGATRLVASSRLPLAPVDANQSTGRSLSIASGLASFGAQRHRDGTEILRRNIFDSATGPLDQVAQPEATGSAPAAPIDPNAPPPPCDGGVRLVGALYRPQNPDTSLAALASSSGTAQVYQKGMQIDGRELVAVHADAVYLRPSGGSLCRVSMFGQLVAAPPPSAAATETAEAGEAPGGDTPGGIPSEELDKGIQQVSEKEFNIARSLLNKVLANQAEIMRSARIVPQREGGRVSGVKLYGIRRNSLLRRIGLQNGDTLRTINGFDMTEPKSALEAYAKLQSADHLTVAIMRRSSPMTIDYSIR